ncbi:MAG: membrane lipoprotein lipid attachment site-containing protein, partial [Oscillospiraceae bacterium]|nr:membrane lipoprotein lipid attachment site-containing protein [Oscillospiraceae bacterium]
MKKVLFLILAVCLMLTGCGKGKTPVSGKPADEMPEITAEKNELKTIASYSDVFEQMSTYFNNRQNNEKYAMDAAVEETAEEPAAEMPAEAPAAEPMETNATAGQGGDGYSETNVQV